MDENALLLTAVTEKHFIYFDHIFNEQSEKSGHVTQEQKQIQTYR